MEFINAARKVINENQDLFVALEELDRTGKLKKVKYKQRVDFTIDEDLMAKFRGYCKKHNIKLSNKVEDLIKEFLMSKKSD